MQDFLQRLRRITNGCRDDMHEPDEQDVTARVIGHKLDNAHGEYINDNYVRDGFQEFIVVIERRDENNRFIQESFNLATLIALARKADLRRKVD